MFLFRKAIEHSGRVVLSWSWGQLTASSCWERTHQHGDVIVINIYCSDLLVSNENSNVFQGSAKTVSFNKNFSRSFDGVWEDSRYESSDTF